ncbi:ATP-binding protein [Lachnospiraceae bacterium 48-21]
MNSTEEQQVALIPRNFMERGTFMGGMFKIRNAIEGAVLAAGIGIPVVHLPLSLTARIIILCMTSLPAAMVALIGIGGESLTAFLMNALRFVKNRRIIYRSDVIPDFRRRRQHARNREPKSQKRKQRRGTHKQGTADHKHNSNHAREEATDSDSLQESDETGYSSRKARKKETARRKTEKKRERRIYDTSTSSGIKKQAKEDIRILKIERKLAKKEQAQALKDAKHAKAERERQRKEAEKEAVRTAKYEKKEAIRQAKYENQEAARLEKEAMREAAYRKKHPDSPSAPAKKKKRKYQTLEDYLPVEKIANGIVYTTDHRYVKILEIEPINFLLRSAREQQSIIYSFISYLKISPVKLQIKMISKKADINRHLEQSARELEREVDPRCRELQQDYIQFVRHLSSREAVSRRFFLIFEYEPFNVNRKTEEKEILAALETAAQTAKTFLYQCGNDVVSHENEDEFTTDVLYTLLNRTLCTNKPLPDRISEVLGQRMAEGKDLDSIPSNAFTAPESLDLKHSNYVRINGLYHTYLMVPSDGYKNKVTPGWLSLLINAGEGIDIDFYLHKQPKDKIQQRLGQQIRINRSKIKDASDTNSDFDDLDSAIRSGYFLKTGLANNEDFYYMNLLITITASDLEELQWRIQEMKKLLISQDMDLRSCYFLQEQGFLSSLPLASLDKKLYELSKRNVLTTGAASCYPFTSYSICDDNGILFGVNKHNNSLVIADIFDSKQYKNSNICILGCSGAGKTFTMQTMALRMRRKGIQVFIIAPLKGHEFYRACKNVGGEFIQISPASRSCINIMEIRKVDNSVNELLDGPTLDASALASKIQKLHIFFSLLIPDMNHEEKQLLDEALIKTYARKGITHKNESLIDPEHPEKYKEMPILEDVYDILMESRDTKRLAHILNRLVHGSASSFNQQTNVDLTNKYTVLDISELTGSSDLLTVGMFVALDYVWDKAKENRTEEKAIFVDEVWQLIGASSNRLAAEFVLEIAKIIRAYSGAGIFATQDLNDFFALDDGKYGKGIINNCKTKIILNMEDEEAGRVKHILHLSETEVMNITHFQRGNGLISTNNNNITVEFKASALEKELITTDRQELLEILARQKQKAG